jgi:hypothetical protein
LIADKKSLNEKCESLVLEMKKSEEHHTNALKAVEERRSVELQRAREMHAAAEKLNRKRWIDSKTQRIKVTLNISVFNMTKSLHVYKYRYFY